GQVGLPRGGASDKWGCPWGGRAQGGLQWSKGGLGPPLSRCCEVRRFPPFRPRCYLALWRPPAARTKPVTADGDRPVSGSGADEVCPPRTVTGALAGSGKGPVTVRRHGLRTRPR